jgi:hypothetical protein
VDAVEFIRDITFKMCDRDLDPDLVESTCADDFVHHGNGATTDKALYLERGGVYPEQYASIDRPQFDELFAVDDRVVVAYTLGLHRNDGSVERPGRSRRAAELAEDGAGRGRTSVSRVMSPVLYR